MSSMESRQLLLSLERLTGTDAAYTLGWGPGGDQGWRDGMGCMTRVDVMKEWLVIMPMVLLGKDASDEV